MSLKAIELLNLNNRGPIRNKMEVDKIESSSFKFHEIGSIDKVKESVQIQEKPML